MKNLLLTFWLSLSAFAGYGQSDSLKITVHPGVELLTIVQKLAGKYPDSTPTGYEREVLAYFKPYQQHPAVQQVQQFKGRVYPDLTELGFCFGDSPDVPLGSLPDSSGWYKSYGKAAVQEYLRQCRAFAVASHFREFYRAHAAAYAAWGAPIRPASPAIACWASCTASTTRPARRASTSASTRSTAGEPTPFRTPRR